jgi:hypothetical protein
MPRICFFWGMWTGFEPKASHLQSKVGTPLFKPHLQSSDALVILMGVGIPQTICPSRPPILLTSASQRGRITGVFTCTTSTWLGSALKYSRKKNVAL